MDAIDALALAARSRGPAKTTEVWRALLGAARLSFAMRHGLLVGPSGTSAIRCDYCDRPGHLIPVRPSDTPGFYDAYCEDAGIFSIPETVVEAFHVPQSVFFRHIAAAFGVADPEGEYFRVADDLHFLGAGRFGSQRFSVIGAMSLRTEDEFRELARLNEQGFGREPGLIVCCDPLPVPAPETGAHALRRFSQVIAFEPDRIRMREGEVRRIVGLPGRPPAKHSRTKEAASAFLDMLRQGMAIPPGTAGFKSLFTDRPDLATLSEATLYEAKKLAFAAHRDDSSLPD